MTAPVVRPVLTDDVCELQGGTYGRVASEARDAGVRHASGVGVGRGRSESVEGAAQRLHARGGDV